jgi:hypothetical protein
MEIPQTTSQVHVYDYTLSVEDAARVLGKPAQDVWHAIHTGMLPHMRMPGGPDAEYRLLPEDVLEFFTRSRPEEETTPEATAAAEEPASETPPASPDTTAPSAMTEDLLRTLIGQLNQSLSTVNERLADEHQRLTALVREQTEALAHHEAEHVTLREQLTAVQARLDALHAEVQTLQRIRSHEAEIGYRAALRGLKHRPWWAHIPDLG